MSRDVGTPHGVLVVHKPVGPSSHDVVAVARRSLGVSRIGHTGTLDPQASGVLPLVVGQATRLAQLLTASDKEYEAVVRFGVVTDTCDASGRIVEESGVVPDAASLEAALPRFRGVFEQTPPAFSAKMIDGERSYVRARAGKPVQAAAVSVRVEALELLALDLPRVRLRVRCSAGFYIRSLAHDLGQLLGTGAILDALVRTEAAGFRLDEALSFERLVSAPREELRQACLPMERLLPELPAVRLTAEGVEWARHGRELGVRQVTGPLPPAAASRAAGDDDRDLSRQPVEPAGSSQAGASQPRTSQARSVVRLFDGDARLVGLAQPAKTPGFLHPHVVFSYN